PTVGEAEISGHFSSFALLSSLISPHAVSRWSHTGRLVRAPVRQAAWDFIAVAVEHQPWLLPVSSLVCLLAMPLVFMFCIGVQVKHFVMVALLIAASHASTWFHHIFVLFGCCV